MPQDSSPEMFAIIGNYNEVKPTANAIS